MDPIVKDVPAIIWILLGYSISVTGGFGFVGWKVKRLYNTILPNEEADEEELIDRRLGRRFSRTIGFLEGIVYTTALIMGWAVFIVAWFTIKTAPQWTGTKERWAIAHNWDKDSNHTSKATYALASRMVVTSMFGNGLNVCMSVIGWAVIEWSGAGDVIRCSLH